MKGEDQNFERVKSEAIVEYNDEAEIEEDIYSDSVDINDYEPTSVPPPPKARSRKSPIPTLVCQICSKPCSGNVWLYSHYVLHQAVWGAVHEEVPPVQALHDARENMHHCKGCDKSFVAEVWLYVYKHCTRAP